MVNLTETAGVFERFASFAEKYPKRVFLALIFGFPMFIAFIIWWNFETIWPTLDRALGHPAAKQALAEKSAREGREVDRIIESRLLSLCLRAGAARCVGRAYVFARNDRAQMIGVLDVFEINDAEARRSGITEVPLPLEQIEGSTSFMLADPNSPRCIARNRDEYEDEGLRAFLALAGLKASVACPIVDLDGDILGLLAVSVRTPLERNPRLQSQVRDEALLFSGYWMRSPKVLAAIERFQDERAPASAFATTIPQSPR